jgi:acetolactate synthase-1/2/3 large subunit
MRVADYMAARTVLAGTDTCFMLPGGMAMHLNDAFGRAKGMRCICHFHEQAAAMAADAYARATGRIGVAIATSGPGATNLLTGLVGAYQDSTPVLFFTGQCKRKETTRGRGIAGLRQCGFLEVDIISIVASVTKYAAFVESPERARYHLEKALYLATHGRPGPVLLDMPLDVQGAPFDEAAAEPFIPPADDAPKPADADVDAIFARLKAAKRPLILAGHGFRSINRVRDFRDLAHRLQIPVVTSLMAQDLMLADDPLYVGHCGPRGARGANFAVQTADFMLILGCSLHVQTVGYEGELFAPHAEKIEIDLDPAVLARESVGVQKKYQWDIRDYLPKFFDRAAAGDVAVDPVWRKACRKLGTKYAVCNEPHDFGPPDGSANLYEFVDTLCDALKGDEIVITDAGQPHPVLGQAFRVKGTEQYINPGSLAEMGYAIPAAIGPAAVFPDRTVVVVTGDGSMQTNVQELQTLVQNGFDVKIFVINNGGFGSIRHTQENYFHRFYVCATPESGVSMPNIEKITTAYGISYTRCERRSNLRATIGAVLARRGPVLCEVMGQHNQSILPGVPSYMLPDGQMRSKALHEMKPDIGVSFEQALAEVGLTGVI